MENAYERLKALIGEMGSVLVAYSGGVDSTLLMAAAHDALGPRALAVTALSATYPQHEKARALELAKQLGARHRLLETHETDSPAFQANPPDRCYHCKRELFSGLWQIAEAEGIQVVLDGNNSDDARDYRPGRKAAGEHRVRSPLAELGLGKAEIRRLARERGLPNWDEPACACLASRIPYGEKITPERLRRIERAEEALRELGLRVLRVRDHGALARIEVGENELEKAFARRTELVAACKAQGYTYACLDLQGYRTGAMNETLAK